MPQAVTHILFPILLVAIYRDFVSRKKFSLHYVLLAGFGGVLPDIDIPLSILFNLELHKTFTHTIFFPASLLFLFFLFQPLNTKAHICNTEKHKLKLSNVFLAISFGVLIHLALDLFLGSQSFLLYPFSNYDFGLNLFSYLEYSWNFSAALMDGILLVIWIMYLELKHKISDFI